MPFVRVVVYGIAKTFSKVFGLATMAFFGRMPSRDDDKMAAVGLLSITWVPVVAAIAFPQLGEMIIPFAPDDDQLIRWIALGTALVIPLVVGLTVSRMHNNEGGRTRSTWEHLWHGFWYTPVIGLAVCGVIVVVPFVKTSYLIRRFSVERMMVMIPSGTYDAAVDHVVASLRRRGIEAEVTEPERSIKSMFRLLGFVLGHIFCRDVADKMKAIRGHDAGGNWFEVTVHAADLSVIGDQKPATRVLAVLAEELDERVVYFTWDDASQRIEDRMREQREQLENGDEPDLDELRQLAEELATLQLDKEEWNNVRRNLYRLERDAYARAAGREDPEAATREVQERSSAHTA
ncbi:hypothetical protein [Egicoccus halophilus]|uniref:Uncharacterized protein n=1 Tax=Egicoccus halophilus TaxID=1670830 RepID=A0A8J3EYY1_9ACTN|nr:hypothetical protein [Egicoccus halophilus]GGI08775.1 hypothetical protein GCM10011354_30770 [Egicoccus halophilus]